MDQPQSADADPPPTQPPSSPELGDLLDAPRGRPTDSGEILLGVGRYSTPGTNSFSFCVLKRRQRVKHADTRQGESWKSGL
ncbi:hypothetical protein INR49_020279, partial [Caranx melampygus]